MNISDFLSNRDVLIGVSASDKVRLLRQLSTHAANELGLDPNNVSEAVARREALGSTGVGNGVALPHARVSNLKQPFGLLARLKHGIDFEAVDDQPVDIVFLLLIPEAADSAQLNALACIARKLRDQRHFGMFVGQRIARASSRLLPSPASPRSGQIGSARLKYTVQCVLHLLKRKPPMGVTRSRRARVTVTKDSPG